MAVSAHAVGLLKMLPADSSWRYGLRRSAGTWVLLLAFHLQILLSEDYLSVTFCTAATPPPSSSANEEEKVVGQRQERPSPRSPDSTQCSPQGGQDCAASAQEPVRMRARLFTASGLSRLGGRRSSLSLASHFTGTVLFVYASLLLGRGGPRGLSSLRCASTAREADSILEQLFSRSSVRDAALVVASLAGALRQLGRLTISPKTVSAVAAADKNADGSHKRSSSGAKDKRRSEARRSWTPHRLQRFGSAISVSEAQLWEPAESEDDETIGSRAMKKSESHEGLQMPDETSPQRERVRFLTLRHKSSGGTGTGHSSKLTTAAGSKGISWKPLKRWFRGKDTSCITPPPASKENTPSPPPSVSDHSVWRGIVAAVADAIEKACDRHDRGSTSPTSIEEATKWSSQERANAYTLGAEGLYSRLPLGTEDDVRVSYALAFEDSQSGGRARRGSMVTMRVTTEEKRSCASGQRGLPVQDDGTSVKKNAASSPSSAKSGSPVPRSPSVRRHSSSERKSSSGSDVQRQQGQKAIRRPRRWLPRSKARPAEISPSLYISSSVENDSEVSKRTSHGSMEALIRDDLYGEGALPLLRTCTEWWRESKDIKAKAILRRITAALPIEQPVREVALKTAGLWVDSVVSGASVDIRFLILRAVRLIDSSSFEGIGGRPEADSFLTDPQCRLAFHVASSDVLDGEVSQAFGLLVQRVCGKLREFLADFEGREEAGGEASENLQRCVAHMQALVAVTEAVVLPEAASAAVEQTSLEFLKLAERTGCVEGKTALAQYYLSGGQSGEKVERARQMAAGIKEEVLARVFDEYKGVIVERMSRFPTPALVEQALKETLLPLLKTHVSRAVSADVDAAWERIQSMATPPFYHLIGLVNDETVHRDIIDHHTSAAKAALPGILHAHLGIALPRLAKEYRWLGQTALLDLPRLFEADRDSLTVRVMLLVVLGDELFLQRSIYMRKLRRVLKVSAQFGIEKNSDVVLKYICEQLSSDEGEYDDFDLPGCVKGGSTCGTSVEEALLQSLGWRSSLSEDECSECEAL